MVKKTQTFLLSCAERNHCYVIHHCLFLIMIWLPFPSQPSLKTNCPQGEKRRPVFNRANNLTNLLLSSNTHFHTTKNTHK